MRACLGPVMWAFLASTSVACGGALQPTELDISKYGADSLTCVVEAKTRTEADACRAAVDRQFCSAYAQYCHDGGKP